MSRLQTAFTIPTIRAEQFRALAHAHGDSVGEFIERLIERGIRKKLIPDELPGFTFKAKGGEVCVTLAGRAGPIDLPAMSFAVALALANLLEQMVTADVRERGVALKVGDVDVLVGRYGRGTKIIVKGAGASDYLTLTDMLALDVSRLLQDAALTAAVSEK